MRKIREIRIGSKKAKRSDNRKSPIATAKNKLVRKVSLTVIENKLTRQLPARECSLSIATCS